MFHIHLLHEVEEVFSNQMGFGRQVFIFAPPISLQMIVMLFTSSLRIDLDEQIQ